MSKDSEKKIWFPAKRYGWGWGPPICWQGWVVMIVYLILVVGGTLLLPAHPAWFVGYAILLCLLLVSICYLKGEKPRWRWGKN